MSSVSAQVASKRVNVFSTWAFIGTSPLGLVEWITEEPTAAAFGDDLVIVLIGTAVQSLRHADDVRRHQSREHLSEDVAFYRPTLCDHRTSQRRVALSPVSRITNRQYTCR